MKNKGKTKITTALLLDTVIKQINRDIMIDGRTGLSNVELLKILLDFKPTINETIKFKK